jgi:hypothetical protein
VEYSFVPEYVHLQKTGDVNSGLMSSRFDQQFTKKQSNPARGESRIFAGDMVIEIRKDRRELLQKHRCLNAVLT